MKIIRTYGDATEVDVIEIKSATYAGNLVIRIDFNDEASRTIDFKPFLTSAIHPCVRQYLDEEKFKQFVITDGNLNWNDYELIFPLEELYEGKIKNTLLDAG